MTGPRLGRQLAAALLLLTATDAARAQTVVRKAPGGPWVTQAGADFFVPAGQPVEWSIRVCNGTAAPLAAQLADYLHSGECTGHEWQELLCPPVTLAGGRVQACDDAASPPITNPALDIRDLLVPANDCVDVIFRTEVDLLAPAGSPTCNIAVFATGIDSGQSVPPAGSGCSCVQVIPALPTQMDLQLRAEVESPPFAAGDRESRVTYVLTGQNATPRAAEGRFVMPIPVGLAYDATLSCPPGATCRESGAREFVIDGLVVPEGGTFEATFRLVGECAGVGEGRICAQGWFEPAEDPSQRILTGDPAGAGLDPTCFKPALSDFVLTKSWRLADDADGTGTPTAGDRIRFEIVAWNRGVAAARDVEIRDVLPLGFDTGAAPPSGVAVSAGGTYSTATGARWLFPEMGPGSVVTTWIDATMRVDAVAPNRAQLTTRVLADCGVRTFLSDDPLTAARGDATSVRSVPVAAPVVLKEVRYSDPDGDGVVEAGEPVTFVLVVRNDGNAAATSVRLSDPLPACLGNATGVTITPPPAGTNASTARSVEITGVGGADGLQPGEVVTIRFSSTVVDPASCCNQATLSHAGGSVASRDPRGLAVPEPTCLVPSARAVRLTKRADLDDANGDGLMTAGERVTYVVTIANEGVAIPDLIINDEVPAGLLVDAASVALAAPGLPPVDFTPAPGGMHGAGRVHADPIVLGFRETATLTFTATILPGHSGPTCNEATILVVTPSGPMTSQDEVTGGPTCFLVEEPRPPALEVSMTASGDLAEGCAQPGETLRLVVTAQSTGGEPATGVILHAGPLAGVVVEDFGGGAPDGDGVTWSDVGDLAPGASASRTLVVRAACDAAVVSASALAQAAGLPDAVAAGVAYTVAEPVLEASATFSHDDTDADGLLDSGEELLVIVTATETGGACVASGLVLRLALPPELDVVALRDGAILAGDALEWRLDALGGGASASVTSVITLDGTPCATPDVVPEAAWLTADGSACGRSVTGAPVATPPGPCDPSGSDLLRDDRVTDLPTAFAILPSLLDEDGVPGSCVAGAVTRVDPLLVARTDVGASLDPGIVLAVEALPVGPGSAGQLVFYEVSDSCDTIRACKVDDDSDPVNGRESLRIGVRGCAD